MLLKYKYTRHNALKVVTGENSAVLTILVGSQHLLSISYKSKRQMLGFNAVHRRKLHEKPLLGIEETIM